jgi:hypothetical protein
MSRHRYGFVLSAILAMPSCGPARDSCGDPPEQTELDLDPPPSGVCPSRAQALRLFASQQPGTVVLSLDSDGALVHEPATYSCCYEIGFGTGRRARSRNPSYARLVSPRNVWPTGYPGAGRAFNHRVRT